MTVDGRPLGHESPSLLGDRPASTPGRRASIGVAAWRTARGPLSLDRPRILGVLNVTPDSFWAGARHPDVERALARAAELVQEGADAIDIGGESSRPGATPVPEVEEIRRVVPVVREVVRRWPEIPVSVDTVKAGVADAALAEGAAAVNDVSGLRLDARLAATVAEHGAGLVLMHSRGDVASMASYELARYGPDPVAEVVDELRVALDRALDAGVPADAVVLDPGLGFSKRTEHSVAVLAGLHRLVELGRPVLVGPSRKRFVGELAGGLPADERLEAGLAACVVALLRGARLFRVHDVAPLRRALAVAEALRGES